MRIDRVAEQDVGKRVLLSNQVFRCHIASQVYKIKLQRRVFILHGCLHVIYEIGPHSRRFALFLFL